MIVVGFVWVIEWVLMEIFRNLVIRLFLGIVM